jgi:hypothetical protein
LSAVNPELPVRDVPTAMRYNTKRLGFVVQFQDDPHQPQYAGVAHDDICLHLQWHDPADFR